MRLTRLELTDLLSYESLDLPLDAVDQIGVVGATGSGKSALLDGVLYALFGAGRGPVDEMIREGASAASAAVEFTMHGRSYRVWRQRSLHVARGESSLTLTIDGEQASGHTMAETQARLNKEIGLSATALLAGPFMVQRETTDQPRDLMHLKEAPRLDLMIELFGLTRFEAYHVRAKEWLVRAEADRDAAERHIADLDALIAGELEARREHDAQEAVVAALDVEVDRLTESVATVREEAAAMQERAQRQEELDAEMVRQQAALDGHTLRLGTLQGQLAKREERLQHKPVMPPANDPDAVFALLEPVVREVAELPDVRQRHGELGQQWRAEAHAVKTLDGVPCQTAGGSHAEVIATTCLDCQFLVDARAAQERLPVLESEGRTVSARLRELEEKSAYAQTLTRDHAAAVDQRARYQVDDSERNAAREYVEQAGAQMLDAQRQIDQLEEAIRRANAERLRIAQDVSRRSTLAAELTRLSEELTTARTERTGAQQRLTAAGVQVAQIRNAKETRHGLAGEQKRLLDRAEALRLLVLAFHRDGIPKLILENGLGLVEDRANEVLGRMPGAWRIDVRTQRELKSGATAESLDIAVSAAGVERPYRMLSGGERFRVDFALRMALATVLARRSGTTIETLWLDEGMGGQDREGREALLDAINVVADEFGLIVVVSHVPDVTDAMPQRLEVTKEDGVSRAELVA